MQTYLTDFGFAIKRKTLVEEAKYPSIGTPTYMPIEMQARLWKCQDGRLRIQYDERADIWCLGVLLYTMLYRVSAFNPDDLSDRERIKSNIINLNYRFPKTATPLAIDLIKKILVEPDKRLTLSDILNHPWFASSQ